MADTAPLTEHTMKRLRALADGNGLAPDALQLVDKNEAVYTLVGFIKFTPKLDITPKRYAGGVRTRSAKMVQNYAALEEEIVRQQKDFVESSAWLPAVITELEADPSHGWGHSGAKVLLPNQTSILAATENCPSCRGNRLIPCTQCLGQTAIVCIQCQGRGQEICQNCHGRGEDPVNPQQLCAVCQGQRTAPCRYCRGAGRLPCPTCQGHGGTPCPACEALGAITQEVALDAVAEIDFQFGRRAGIASGELPSGLVRALDRLGVSNLTKGHADIKIVKADGVKELELHATLPYADIKLRLNGKTVVTSSFGKRGLLFGMPAFLDDALAPSLDHLKRAAAGTEILDKALAMRIMRDALALELVGKGVPNELRRLYPIGLSPEVAQDIVRNMSVALRRYTLRTRVLVAVCGVLLSVALFVGIYMTTVHVTMLGRVPLAVVGVIDGALPFVTLGLVWLGISQSTRWMLQSRYPHLPIRLTQKIGKIGMGALGAIVLSYLAITVLSPSHPIWMLRFFHS